VGQYIIFPDFIVEAIREADRERIASEVQHRRERDKAWRMKNKVRLTAERNLRMAKLHGRKG
jgi:hypothetical protein